MGGRGSHSKESELHDKVTSSQNTLASMADAVHGEILNVALYYRSEKWMNTERFQRKWVKKKDGHMSGINKCQTARCVFPTQLLLLPH